MTIPSLPTGWLEGRYRLDAPVARGGMATVYRGYDTKLDRVVAIKIMHPDLAALDDFTRLFQREARAVAALSSPHIVTIYDRGVWNDGAAERAYLVMEYVPGPTLRHELERLGSFQLGTALDICDQVLQGLAAAHRAGIIHRDIKPENILFDDACPPPSPVRPPQLAVTVTDFGLAHAVSASSGALPRWGTLAYTAPEILEQRAVSPACDIYATGLVLFELLAGRLPWAGYSAAQLAAAQARDDLPRLAGDNPWLPAQVDSFIGVLTAKNPADRPASAVEARELLRGLRAGIADDAALRRIPVTPRRPQPVHREDEAGGCGGAELETAVAASTGRAATLNAGADATVPVRAPVHRAPSVLRPTQKLTARPASSQQDTALSPRGAGTPRQHSAGRRRARAWRIAAWICTIALLAGAGGATWALTAGPWARVTVPELATGLTQARSQIEALGLTVETEVRGGNGAAPGTVLGSDPEAGSRVRPGSTVELLIAGAALDSTVPDVADMAEAEARAALKKAGFQVQVRYREIRAAAPGTVLRQDPGPGISAAPGQKVTLIIAAR
ncbi:protein kinase domain-containing protein [Actinotignum timonense]|uniref:non-specific serine/threonine protein kinase n=4 Tax=Actinotignum timonense TaxID=1870995 RepID=A0ABU5GD82_9ACTO|nr:protein kinase [Actinotignum timonense]MDK6906267.1 protein kinase [Actinotignum timonense]MDY5146577.1 protein kinase [Actinotignum timonense]